MAKRCPTLSRYVILSVAVLNPSTVLLASGFQSVTLSWEVLDKNQVSLTLKLLELIQALPDNKFTTTKSYPNSVITTFCNIISPGFSVEGPIVAVPKLLSIHVL